MPAAVIADCHTDILRYFVKGSDEFFNRFALPLWIFLQSFIEGIDIGAMVFVMVEMLDVSTDKRREGVVFIGEVRESVHEISITLFPEFSV